MLRSLVGSEMCIRDSINAEYGGPAGSMADDPPTPVSAAARSQIRQGQNLTITVPKDTKHSSDLPSPSEFDLSDLPPADELAELGGLSGSLDSEGGPPTPVSRAAREAIVIQREKLDKDAQPLTPVSRSGRQAALRKQASANIHAIVIEQELDKDVQPLTPVSRSGRQAALRKQASANSAAQSRAGKQA
eukprot:TRINITY_DN1435_c0_g1_i3.p1 TRINITY_DN1435_c0_g1~~TRINITY_DN1435_c0_g1_i3.p1  ORF type:complete len:189 (-),score=47.66 TRINITY_DN1435_c0_g1_i3:390-956(-)